MKTATVEDLSQHAADLLRWVEAGEEVNISRLGAVIARLVPPAREESAGEKSPDGRVDWTQSAAFRRDRTGERVLSAEESLALVKDAGGRY